MAALSYLNIRGTLAENMTYRPKAGYESSRPGRRVEGHPDFQLVLVNREGRKLLSVAPQVDASCRRAGDPRRYRVRGILPLHPHAAAYELWRGDVRLHGGIIPAEPPRLAAPNCHPSSNGIVLHWQPCECERRDPCESDSSGSDHSGAFEVEQSHPVTYSIVAEMESGHRITVARGLEVLAYNVDLSRMPISGSGMLYLVANDGVRSAQVSAVSIEVPSRAPTVHIISPAPGTSVPFGQALSILGCCLDMAGQPCPPERAEWSIDGRTLAKGAFVVSLDDLRPGTHKLTLTYQPAKGERVEVTGEVDVELPDESFQAWEALVGDVQPNRKSA